MPRPALRLLALLVTTAALSVAAPVFAQTGTPIEATNAAGDKILLYPDGRWEYADPARRAAMPKPSAPPAQGTPAPSATGTGAAASGGAVSAKQAGTVPNAAPTGPTQGGWLFGRRVPEGDPDYNRGSLNPKTR